MKKKLVTILLALCLAGSMGACRSSNDSSSKGKMQEASAPASSKGSDLIITSDFQEDNINTLFFHNINFEVPNNWIEKNSSDETLYFYPDNGMLTIGYAKDGGILSSETDQEDFIDGWLSAYDNSQLLDSYSDNIGISKVESLNFTYGFEYEESPWYGECVAFNVGADIYTFSMATYSDSNVSHQEDFDKILSSLIAIEEESSSTTDSTVSTVENMGISVEDFLNLYLPTLESNGIVPSEQKDMDLLYILYFDNSAENGNMKFTVNNEGYIETINIDKNLNNLDAIVQCCLDTIGITADKTSFLQELEQKNVLEQDGFLFSNNDDFYVIMSDGGKISNIPTENDDSEEALPESQETDIPLGHQNALSSALDYLDFSSFSYTGLIEQLEYEGYTNEEATYAADNCGADWNEQAARMAQDYLDYSSFSRQGLIDQLIYEGFTSEQAEYGVTAVGY